MAVYILISIMNSGSLNNKSSSFLHKINVMMMLSFLLSVLLCSLHVHDRDRSH